MPQTLNQRAQATHNTAPDPPLLVELLANVSAGCATEIRAFCRESNGARVHNLTRMWSMGKRIENLKRPEFKVSVDGQPINPLLILGKIEGISKSYLGKMSRFYRFFDTIARRDWMLGLRMKSSGRPLVWAHWEQLLKFQPAEGRSMEVFDELVQKVVDGDWKPEDIDQYIKNLRLAARQPEARGGGRPTHVPPTFHGRMTRFIQQTNVLLKNASEIYTHPTYNLFDAIKAMSQEEVATKSAELTAEVRKLEDNLKALMQLSTTLRTTELPDMLAHIQLCARQRAEQSGRRAAAELEDEDT